MEGSPEQDWPAIHRHKGMKTARLYAGLFNGLAVRMLGDHETKARDPETVPTQHYEKDRSTNELCSLEP